MNDKPNVIMLMIDNVRYDHVSCYGYSKKITPNIDEFAKESVLFENMFSVSSWTPPTLASMFTGKYPSHHGVLEEIRLDHKNTTFAELLKKNGYRTLKISSSPIITEMFGFNKGFDISVEQYTKPILRFDMQCLWGKMRNLKFGCDKNTYYKNVLAKRLIEKNKTEPLFLFLHYENTHSPYHPMRPFHKKILKEKKNADLGKVRNVFGEPGFLGKILRDKNASTHEVYKYMAGNLDLTEEEIDLAVSWYDSEIAYMDYHLGELFEFLKEKNIFDDSIIIVNADHGTNLKEHRLFFHSLCSLYDTNTHVPFMIKLPHGKKKSIRGLVSLVDFMPTMLDILGIKVPDNIDGKNLAGFKESECRKYVLGELGKNSDIINSFRSLLPSYNFSALQRLKFIRTNTHKLILGSEGRREFYDLRKDPDEEDNVIDKHPKESKKMEKEIMNRFKNLENKRTKSIVDDLDV